jgi:hypothetical protein
VLVLVVDCNGNGEMDDVVVKPEVLSKRLLSCSDPLLSCSDSLLSCSDSVLALILDCNGDKGDETEAVEVLFLLLLLFCSGSSSC